MTRYVGPLLPKSLLTAGNDGYAVTYDDASGSFTLSELATTGKQSRVLNVDTISLLFGTGALGFTPGLLLAYAMNNNNRASYGYAKGTSTSTDQTAWWTSTGGIAASFGNVLGYYNGSSNALWRVTQFSSSGILIQRTASTSVINNVVLLIVEA